VVALSTQIKVNSGEPYGPMETSLHLCTCPFAQVVWTQALAWENFNVFPNAHPAQFDSIGAWWESAIRSVPSDKERHFNGLVIYIMWNIWKERNRRIFITNTLQLRVWQLVSRRTWMSTNGRFKDILNLHFVLSCAWALFLF
jgi:hypothetical protein